MRPFFSAILPTTDRRIPFLPLAFENLKRQQSNDVEVIVVSEDQACLSEARQLLRDSGLTGRGFLSPPKVPLGYKRNIACEQAKGEWITFWDDDDWSRSDRLAVTKRFCTETVALVGSQTMLIHELVEPRRRTAAYHYAPLPNDASYPPWFFVGGLMTFRKSLWARFPFGDSQTGEEAWWQMKLPSGIPIGEITPDPTIYVSMLHGANTAYISAALPHGDPTITIWKDRQALADLIGADTLTQYEKAALKKA